MIIFIVGKITRYDKVILPYPKMVLAKSIEFAILKYNSELIIVMSVVIAIFALSVCIVVITISIRVYKESPKIRKNDDDD